MFKKESEFEVALIELLSNKGWNGKSLNYPTENDLIDNWAEILFQNNKQPERLNGQRLTKTEINQLKDKINRLSGPCEANEFINGKTVLLKRDNPNDKEHLNKEVSLEIFNPNEISGGNSVYQIARQPIFNSIDEMDRKSRGDVLLLINGLPVIHIELKRSGSLVKEAKEQIRLYSKKGAFTGFYSLIQIFVAMTPDTSEYFTNPGSHDAFNPKFQFKWADFHNNPVSKWDEFANSFLNIPMAHELIGYYVIADKGDNVLKVLRSYQYYAVREILNKVRDSVWSERDNLGGYIWHTTGSGKTLTSFKAADILAKQGKCDKVVFIMDRIELGNQSTVEFRNFCDSGRSIQDTRSTNSLKTKLLSQKDSDRLLVTSIQKLYRIKEEEGINEHEIKKITKKNIVLIFDECHRTTFGEMLLHIKKIFKKAMFFGFTGTPIFDNKNDLNQTDIFGDQLHSYTILDGMNDKNVLTFDTVFDSTFNYSELREKLALHITNSNSYEEIAKSSEKLKIFNKIVNEIEETTYRDKNGNVVKGVEDFIPSSFYKRNEQLNVEQSHQYQVVTKILNSWNRNSNFSKFHAIFATSSIEESLQYYQLFKEVMGTENYPILKISLVVDSSVDLKHDSIFKEDMLKEVLIDYNKNFDKNYTLSNFGDFKRDVCMRLAHKENYTKIEASKHLNLVIVVDQLLTGYDSKWVNTLYLDKVLDKEHLIQAFSRTNRILDDSKSHGIIQYFRKPYTMKQNIKEAMKMYCNSDASQIFVNKLPENIRQINKYYEKIILLFETEDKMINLNQLPKEKYKIDEFCLLFTKIEKLLYTSRYQGFDWDCEEAKDCSLNEKNYLILKQRFNDLIKKREASTFGINDFFVINATGGNTILTKINTDYLNGIFESFVKIFQNDGNDKDYEASKKIKDEMFSNFGTLSAEDQDFAHVILGDIENGKLTVESDKTLYDYINIYKERKYNLLAKNFCKQLGLEYERLSCLMYKNLNENNFRNDGKFKDLLDSLNIEVAQKFFQEFANEKLSIFDIRKKAWNLVKIFLINGPFDVNNYFKDTDETDN